MKLPIRMLLSCVCLPGIIYAQRTQQPNQNNQQPVKPVVVSKSQLSSRANFSISGKDSLRVELVNIDVPGLDIISCEQCTVDAPWYNLVSGGELNVIVKNNGREKSKPATVWIAYGLYKTIYTKWGSGNYFGEKLVRKGVPELNPGETIRIKFNIVFSAMEYKYNNSKYVSVVLSKSGERSVL